MKIQQAYLMISQLPPEKIIAFSAAIVFLIIGFNLLVVTPIIFNYIIIPRIENKIGKKLQFSNAWDFFLFGNFFYRNIEIINYIVSRFIALKIKRNFHRNVKSQNSALTKVNYDIRTASRFEIIMSFFVVINIILTFIDFFIIWKIS